MFKKKNSQYLIILLILSLLGFGACGENNGEEAPDEEETTVVESENKEDSIKSVEVSEESPLYLTQEDLQNALAERDQKIAELEVQIKQQKLADQQEVDLQPSVMPIEPSITPEELPEVVEAIPNAEEEEVMAPSAPAEETKPFTLVINNYLKELFALNESLEITNKDWEMKLYADNQEVITRCQSGAVSCPSPDINTLKELGNKTGIELFESNTTEIDNSIFCSYDYLPIVEKMVKNQKLQELSLSVNLPLSAFTAGNPVFDEKIYAPVLVNFLMQGLQDSFYDAADNQTCEAATN